MAQESRSRILSWVVLVVAAAACFWVAENTRNIKGLRTQIDTVNDQLTGIQAAIASIPSRTALDKVYDEIAMLREELVHIEDELASAARAEETAVADNVVDMDDMMAGLFEAVADNERDDKDDEKQGFGGMFSKMFSGEQGKKMAEYSARASVDMLYGGFFDEVDLPEDVADQVREVITSSMTEQITLGMEMAKGGLDSTGQKDTEKDRTERLRTDLAQLLTADELAIWDEYEATKEERMLTRQYDMQLGMFAGGMAPENRELAADILVDEILALDDRERDPDAAKGMRAQLDGQRQAFANARERLAEYVDEKELAHFDRFIEQQESALDMAAEIMSEMRGQKTKPKENKDE